MRIVLPWPLILSIADLKKNLQPQIIKANKKCRSLQREKPIALSFFFKKKGSDVCHYYQSHQILLKNVTHMCIIHFLLKGYELTRKIYKVTKGRVFQNLNGPFVVTSKSIMRERERKLRGETRNQKNASMTKDGVTRKMEWRKKSEYSQTTLFRKKKSIAKRQAQLYSYLLPSCSVVMFSTTQ